MNKALFGLMIIVLLSGCATPPLSTRGEFYTDHSFEEAKNIILNGALSCWQRKDTMFLDGINIDYYTRGDSFFVLTANRYASDVGSSPAFFIVEVQDLNSAQISLNETLYGYTTFGAEVDLNFSEDVKTWLKNGVVCAKKSG